MKSKPQCAPNLDHYNKIRHLPDLYEKFSTFWSLQHFQSIIKINAQKDQFSTFVFPFLVKSWLLDKDANPFRTNFSKKSISGQKSGKSDHLGQLPPHNDLPSRHCPNSIWTPDRIPTDTLRKLTHHFRHYPLDTIQIPSKHHPDTLLAIIHHHPDTVQTPSRQPSGYCLDTIQTASKHHPDTLQTIIHHHPDTVQTLSGQPFWYCQDTIQIASKHHPGTLQTIIHHHLDTVQTPSRQPSEDFQDTIQTPFKHHSDTFGYLADINRQFGVSDTLLCQRKTSHL